MTKHLVAASLAAIVALTLSAQTPPAEPEKQPPPPPESQSQTPPSPDPQTPPAAETQPAPPSPEPQPQPAAAQPQTVPPSVLSDAASGAYERRDSLPSVNLYLPEGQASVRLRKLIRNVLFESQIDYNFVDGDISTFLRYKYYARNYTYRIGLFDAIEFPDLASSNKKNFERVRGGLLLVGVPKDYNNRWFLLLQNDQLTFGDTLRPDDQTSNIYAKVGYQFGTQFDERLNSIVGEQRGRITPVLTAFRDIGPQKTGLAAAITQAGNLLSADYQYTKFEAEGLRRFDLTSTSFVFSRLHVGTFLAREQVDVLPPPRDRDEDGDIDEDDATPTWELYQIPQNELFRLGGREALKSVSGDDSIGTHELHLTNELFVPIFRNRDYKLGPLHWNTLYGIGYVGAGVVGFEYDDLASNYVVDAGIGTESAISYQDWEIYLSVIAAHPVAKPDEIGGGTKVRFSVRTVR